MFFPPVERIESTSGRGNRMPGERRSYSPKFREDAVSLVIDASRSIAAVAREVGVAEETLSNWVDAYRRDRADGRPPVSNQRATTETDSSDNRVVKRRQRRKSQSPTIADVAREAGVSTASVSRVLNGVQPLSPELIKAVQDASARLDFRINGVARALRVQRTQTIGVVVPNITYPFFPQLIQALEVHLRSEGFGMLLADSLDEVELEAERVDELLNRQVDGLIIGPCQMIASRNVVERASSRVRVVQFDRQSSPKTPYVGTNHSMAMKEIVDHLRGVGRRNFAYLGGHPNNGPAYERRRFYIEQMRGDPSRGRLYLGDFSFESGVEGASQIMRSWPEVDAIICGNDLIALGAIRGLSQFGLGVPGDVAVTGYDDTPYASLGHPGLTTVRQPLSGIAVEAVARLLGKRSDLQLKLPAELIVRESTTVAAAQQPTAQPAN